MITQSAYDGCADVWSSGITAIELSKGEWKYDDYVDDDNVDYDDNDNYD